MPQIRPISDLRNKFAEISHRVHETSEPIFLTKNGYGDMVVMSVELYEKLGIAAKLAEQGEQQSHEKPRPIVRDTVKAEKNDAQAGNPKIQNPLSKWQKTLSDLVSK